MYRIVLYCIASYRIVLYYIVLYYIILYCIILYCIVLYYIVLFYIILSICFFQMVCQKVCQNNVSGRGSLMCQGGDRSETVLFFKLSLFLEEHPHSSTLAAVRFSMIFCFVFAVFLYFTLQYLGLQFVSTRYTVASLKAWSIIPIDVNCAALFT